jgi:hypothetical protein
VGRRSWRGLVAPGFVLMASMTLSGPGRAVLAPAPAEAQVAAPVLTVTGDIDGCHEGEDTAELAAKIAGPIATVGDNAYPDGGASEYARCYAPTWGKLKDRTHPVAGNHDYDTAKAAPYYDYFGAAAGDPAAGWYSYDVGSWHVVALNSNCDDVDCSKEAGWLDSDLTANPSACILAYWHHPRFTSGTSGGDSAVGAFWKVLYEHRATLVFNGHDHDYERFAPQDPSGRTDRARGIRQFVVGTGGAALGSLNSAAPNSEVRNNRAYGVLELTLRPDGYDWRFVPTPDGDDFTDSGSDSCKGTAPAAPAPAAEPAAPPPAPEKTAPSTGPSEAQPSPPPATAAPTNPTSGRRRSNTAPAAPAPAPRSAPAGSTSGAAKPTATRPTAPAGPSKTVASADREDPALAPAPTALPAGAGGESAPAETTPPISESADPGAADIAGDQSDTAPLALAISGLIDRSSPLAPPGPDRRALALAAVALLVADGAALVALRHRRGGVALSLGRR